MVETGIYVRIQRDGKWQPIDVGEMTEEELAGWTKDFDAAEGKTWTVGLVKWIQEYAATAQPNGADSQPGGKTEP